MANSVATKTSMNAVGKNGEFTKEFPWEIVKHEACILKSDARAMARSVKDEVYDGLLEGGGGLVCAYTTTFRKLAKTLVKDGDLVIELGSSYGACSQVLAKACRNPSENLLCLETSLEAIDKCRLKFPDIADCFHNADVLMEPQKVADMAKSLLKKKNISQCNQALNVFVDIGGSRALEASVMLLQFLEVTLKPITNILRIVVKNEALHKAGTNHIFDEKDWKMKILEDRHTTSMRKGIIDAKNDFGSVTNYRINRKKKKPLRAKIRFAPDGTAICRFHNYDIKHGCKRFNSIDVNATKCTFDHVHCHECIQPGHRAFECKDNGNSYLS